VTLGCSTPLRRRGTIASKRKSHSRLKGEAPIMFATARVRSESDSRHPRRLATAAMGSLLIAAALPTATLAQARERQLKLHIGVSGQQLAVAVSGSPAARCSLVARDGRTVISPGRIVLTKAGHGTFRWSMPADAPSGTWTLATSCTARRRTSRAHTELLLLTHQSSAPDGSGGKGGGDQSCAEIATAPGGEACFIGDPFAIYEAGTDVGQCTWYAAGMRPDLDGITTGNAGQWLKEASGKKPEGSVPVVGAIAVNTTADDGVGHVAYVAGVKNEGATLILDEANLKYDAKVYLNVETPASEFQGYIYGGPAGNGPNGPPSPTSSPTPSPTPTPAPTPNPSPAPPPPPTFAETTGSVVHTWTDYSNAGGSEGPSIPSYATVAIQCKVTGFRVEDGNTWWYRIAASPWSGNYYASADAFYNNGETSGSLKGTPFVDPSVPNC
jgi:surface antigen